MLQTFGDWITNRVRVWVHSRSSLSASSRRAWISSSESKRSSGMSRIHSWIRAMAPRQCCRSNAKRPRHRGGYPVAFRTAAAALRHSHPTPRALPPDRCDTDVGSHQPHQCPLGAPECIALCPPVGDHTQSIFLDEEMHHLRPYRQWQDRPKPGGQESIPGRQSLPGNRQDLGGVPWVRRRSHQATEARWRRCARQYAVADEDGGKGQGQNRIGCRWRRALMAATIWACRQSA